MKWFFSKKSYTETESIITKINRLNGRNKFQASQYFYAFMVELQDGGISLVDVGSKSFFNKNWRFIHNKEKQILVIIYDLYLNDKVVFYKLMTELIDTIESPEFIKWVTIPWFRFFKIKSLHDSSITSIRFDETKQELTIFMETKSAIDYIPFNNEVEMMFVTRNFHPQNFEDLVKCVDSNASIIFDINTFFEQGEFMVEVDYECFINTKIDYVLPNLKFICENVQINNT